jgi:hypothetical protein
VGLGTEEYLELIGAIAETPPEKLSKQARYCDVALEFDAGSMRFRTIWIGSRPSAANTVGTIAANWAPRDGSFSIWA